MKFRNYIAGLLAVYMLTLMLMPCNDTCTTHEQEALTTIQTAQEHHEEDNDLCSPFCFCSCCATAMTALHFPVFNVVPPVSMQKFDVITQSFSSQEHSAVWQPPKFS